MVSVVGISVWGAEERELSEEVVFSFWTARRGHVHRSPSEQLRPASTTHVNLLTFSATSCKASRFSLCIWLKCDQAVIRACHSNSNAQQIATSLSLMKLQPVVDHPRSGVLYNFFRVYLSVCLSDRHSDDNLSKAMTYEVHICTSISPGNTGQVRIWMLSGQGQGHRSKKSKILIPAM